MKSLIRLAAAATLSLGLVACATTGANSPQMTGQFQQGKSAFATGNYTQAFNNLLPVAKAGNPDAQYAVGYMYYYGKGVVENKQMASYWMGKAAAQGQPAANKALTAINTQSN